MKYKCGELISLINYKKRFIQTIRNFRNNPNKFLSEYVGMDLKWYQKALLNMVYKRRFI